MRFVALIVLSFAFVACHKDTPPAATPPDNTGGEVQAGGKFACATDDDCVVSCAQRENCCDQLCPPCRQAYHKDELAELEAWRAGPGACEAQECPMAKCMAPTEATTARCQEGQCVVETTPITN